MADNGHLTPPSNTAIEAIKDAASSNAGALRGHLDRSTSSIIKEEGEELREAAEQSLNVILDIDLDGKIRWASPSWGLLVGTKPESIRGRPVVELLPEHQNEIFANAVQQLRKDDSGSKVVRFAVRPGKELSQAAEPSADKTEVSREDQTAEEGEGMIDLEAQGIMIYGTLCYVFVREAVWLT